MTTIGGMVQDILGTAFTSKLWLSTVAVLESRLCVPIKERGRGTYVVEPGHLVRFGIRVNVALEVHVVALFNVVCIQIGSHLQCH